MSKVGLLFEIFKGFKIDLQDTGEDCGGRKVLYRLFDTIHDGCPGIDSFNGVDLSFLRQHQLTKKQWSYYALRVCVRHYKKKFGHQLSARASADER